MIPDIPEFIRDWFNATNGYIKLENLSSTNPFYTFRMPYEFQFKEVQAKLSNAENSAITIDVKASDKSVFSTLLTIDPGKTEGKESSNVSLGDDEEIQLSFTIKDPPKEETKIQIGFEGYQKVNIPLARKRFADTMRDMSIKDIEDAKWIRNTK